MNYPTRPRSPLWIVVLGLACEEPMHPYRMQTLIRQRGKDQVANVAQRNSVYQTIDALERAGLIVARETTRDENRPERTTYEATSGGREALREWIRAALATPAREFPEFPAALSTLYGVDGTGDFRALLEARLTALEPRLSELEAAHPDVPRMFLLESEFMAAVTRAEMNWLRGVIADLKSGRLRQPTEKELLQIAPSEGGPSAEAARRISSQADSHAPRRNTGKGARGRSSKSKKKRAKQTTRRGMH